MIVQAISSTVLWVVVRRRRVARGVEAAHDVEQQRQHEQRDQGDDHQQQVVQRRDLLHQRRVGGREAHLPIVGHADRPASWPAPAAPDATAKDRQQRSEENAQTPLADHTFCPLSPLLSSRDSDLQNPPQFKAVSTRYRSGGNGFSSAARYVAASRSRRAFGAATAHCAVPAPQRSSCTNASP